MQAFTKLGDSPRGSRGRARPHRARFSARSVERACTLLLAFSTLCVTGLNLAGTAQASTQGEAIVRAAASMHGQAYCFDGGTYTGPTHGDGGSGCGGATRGFDCSGLALFAVFQGTGGQVRLPHKASAQAVYGGQVITSQAALQPGDLVFFGGGSMARAVHVAIYAGNKEVWVAEDYGIPVRRRALSYITHGLPFDGGVRFWSASSAPSAPVAGSSEGGGASNSPTQGASSEPVASTPPGESSGTSAPAQAPTYPETPGSVVHTWSDYANAGGAEGPEIPSNGTVQIACKVNGFTVADGNTWWYRIASAPWNGSYYGSADAFYNDGATSGSLLGTPFVDAAVPDC
jgi:hypothetical protein